MEQTRPDIILIAYYFPPVNAIGGVRPYRFYKYLKRLGYACTVITASAQGTAPPADVIVVPDEIGEGWNASNKPRRSFATVLEWLVRRFAFPGAIGVIWGIAAARRCRELFERGSGGRPVVIYTTFPPLGVLLAGLLLARRRHVARWVCDFRDPFFSGVPTRYFSAVGRTVARWLETRAFRAADAVVANTGAMAREWLHLHPPLRDKVHVIFNSFDPEQRLRARELPTRNCRMILHAGALYGGRRPTIIMEALQRLRRTSPLIRDVCVVLQGAIGHEADMPTALVEDGIRDGWLEIRDQTIPRVEAERLVEEADGLLLLQPQSAIQIPGKLFDYICVGRPILALVPKGSAVEEVLAGSGLPFRCVYPDEPPESIDRKILEYLALPRQPVPFSESFDSDFSAVSQTERLHTILLAITGMPLPAAAAHAAQAPRNADSLDYNNGSGVHGTPAE